MTPEERATEVITAWSIDPDVIYERVVAAIWEAVLEEREACAKIALGDCGFGESPVCQHAERIGKAIRARPAP